MEPHTQLRSSCVSCTCQRALVRCSAASVGLVLASFTSASVTSSLVRWRTAVSLSSRYLVGCACTALAAATHSSFSTPTAWLVTLARFVSAPRRARCHATCSLSALRAISLSARLAQASSASFCASQVVAASAASAAVRLPWVISRACRRWQCTCLSSFMR